MRLCCVGDSFTNGTGDDDCLGWPGRIGADARARGRDLTLYNLGIRRDTSADILRRWDAETAARLPPDCDGRLVFCFGVNDCVHEEGGPRVAADASLANARAILRPAAARWPTLVLGPPPAGDAALDEHVQALSERQHALCRELAIPFLPLFPVLRHDEAWRREAVAGDGVHPNRGGYSRIAAAILTWSPWRAWVDGPGSGLIPVPAPALP
ncbi:MAG: lipase [Gluconacetobacter diazotrophicus]|nr:lipase [Gluconacetobacter diazotrophicus]